MSIVPEHQTVGAMRSSTTLLSLPIEVRLNIWSQLFVDEWLYIDPCYWTSQPYSQLRKEESRPAVLTTCRQIQQEATPVYYSNLQVHFDLSRSARADSLVNWLENVGKHAVLIRRFEMRWDNYSDISLDLRRNTSKYKISRTRSQHEAVQIYTYHQRLTALLQQIAITKPGWGQRVHIPLLQLSTCNPTTSTQLGAGHSLSIKGVPISTAVSPSEFWAMHGTAEFCRVLSQSLSGYLDNTLTSRGAFKGVADIVNFIMLADEHASALRWLGYW